MAILFWLGQIFQREAEDGPVAEGAHVVHELYHQEKQVFGLIGKFLVPPDDVVDYVELDVLLRVQKLHEEGVQPVEVVVDKAGQLCAHVKQWAVVLSPFT